MKIMMLLILCSCLIITFTQAQTNEHLMWFRQPAGQWNEALPVGNGAMAAMVFGGTRVERIQLNEESIWSGKAQPKILTPDYAAQKAKARELLFAGKHKEAEKLISELKVLKYTAADGIKINSVTTKEHGYETAGDLMFYFDADARPDSAYKRALDLSTGLVHTSWTRGTDAYSQEVFCSYPDKVIAIRISAGAARKLSFTMQMTRPVTTEEEIGNFVSPPKNLKNVYPAATSSQADGYMIMRGQASDSGVSFGVQIKVVAPGAKISADGFSLKVSQANEVTIFVHINSDYYGPGSEKRGRDVLDKAVRKGYAALKDSHIKDHSSLYNRVEINLGKGLEQYPLDVRMRNVRNDLEDNRTKPGLVEDPGLLALFFQFNRYMMIASSRPDTFPPALHFWNQSLYPGWYGRGTMNINQQMNYWGVEVANLSECHLPMLDYLERALPAGQEIAAKAYESAGAVFPGRGISIHGLEFIYDAWNDAGGWFAAHFYDHYKYTQDKGYLAKHAYPYMKQMTLFYLDFLKVHPDSGYLLTGPSYSPENGYQFDGLRANYAMGVTMSKSIIHELFVATLEAAKKLGVDKELQTKISGTIPRLAPYKVSRRYNILQEWDDDFMEDEPGNRHLSHLYAVYPGSEINEDSTLLFAAAKNALQRRIDYRSGWTAWTRAWMTCLAARFKDSVMAGKHAEKMVRSHTFPNFFTTNKRAGHEMYTLDGNFGAIAGTAEILLQSHREYIELLPALPPNWFEGSVKGFRARGGFELDFSWSKGRLVNVKLISVAGQKCQLRYAGKTKSFDTEKGKSYSFSASDF